MVLLAAFCMAACSRQNADVYLICHGTVHLTTEENATSGPEVVDGQEFAVHIHSGTITFSGTNYFRGTHAPLCPSGTGGTVADEVPFDSDPCSNTHLPGLIRQHGIWNPITGDIWVNDDNFNHPMLLREGWLKCRKSTPTQ